MYSEKCFDIRDYSNLTTLRWQTRTNFLFVPRYIWNQNVSFSLFEFQVLIGWPQRLLAFIGQRTSWVFRHPQKTRSIEGSGFFIPRSSRHIEFCRTPSAVSPPNINIPSPTYKYTEMTVTIRKKSIKQYNSSRRVTRGYPASINQIRTALLLQKLWVYLLGKIISVPSFDLMGRYTGSNLWFHRCSLF